ncbi:FolC bifunctional protein [Paenibacillus algicola]|uniref:Dihydrofolate synthase/folylpolyglutamate synthase n=2 Tax=Paenibacillus algicola TaxID=2565926 RepID=A0A4P8XK64_9BACL|nr:FolC bifunctional protein [Paenibacillus algicola]
MGQTGSVGEDMMNKVPAAPFETYTEAVNWINGLIPFGIRPGLERIELLLERLGHPERRLKFVHVAGTNGKGSTCAFLTRVLLQGGYSVGTFTSPYITKFTNRFQIDGEDIEEEVLLKLANQLYPLVQEIADSELGSPTMFEVSTALAILFYSRERVPDVVVWETGLGGRMDVTNVVHPVVSVITNIGMDHTDILGETIQEIAAEKAGIIKPGVPVVTAVSQPEALEVIRQTAASKRATLYAAGEQFSYERLSGDENSQKLRFSGPFRELELEIGMQGEHQCQNAACAMMAIDILRHYMAFVIEPDDLQKGFTSTRWAGRLEQVSQMPRLILDGAHNPEGAESLAKSLPGTYRYRKLNLMMGMLSNKHHEDYLKHILPIVDTLIITEPDFRRKMDANALADVAERIRESYAKPSLQIIIEPDWRKALEALKSRTEAEDLGVVSGTLYLIADVRSDLLGLSDAEKGW